MERDDLLPRPRFRSGENRCRGIELIHNGKVILFLC
jgi:hypothetical protein